MRRAFLLVLTLSACDSAEAEYEWSDAPGIEVCQAIVDECAHFCADAADSGSMFCSSSEYDQCRERVLEPFGLVELVPGLHVQLTSDVTLGRSPSCEYTMQYLAAWRFE